MADHLSDEEQLQLLKNWWKDNGASLVIAILVGLIAYFGFQWWQNHQQQQAEQAAAVYEQLLESLETTNNEALSDEKKATANYLTEQLQNDFSGSQYAVNASLFAAKVAVENQDLDSAAKLLSWSVEHADDNMKSIVELRLARVLLSQEKYDEALALVNEQTENAFISLRSELKGDILAAKGDTSSAQQAYQQAINTLGETASFRQRLLPIKLANLSTGEK